MELGTLVNRVPFSKNGLQVLAGMYLGGLLLGWDQYGLFDSLFDTGIDPEMCVLHWNFSALLSEMMLVINLGKANAFLLRLNMAPEYIWLGLHWAGTPENVPISAYLSSLGDLLADRPLLAGAVLHRTDPVNQQWQPIMGALLQYLDSASASVAPATSDVNMEICGVETPPPSYADTMLRDLSTDMDVCETPAIGLAAEVPSRPAMSPDCKASPTAKKAYRARY
ncbi:unnamed protein product [Penicillium olsonii]|nr:unnamed protein product [Penicillium olsonii]